MIRRRLPAVFAFAAAALPAVAGAGGTTDVRTLSADVAAAGAQRVAVEAPVGEFRVEGTAASTVAVEVAVRCEEPVKTACRQKAERIELVAGADGDDVVVALRGWPKGGSDGLSLSLRVTMPRDLPLTGEFGVGELDVRGLEAGVRLELGVGEMSLELPAASVRRAELEVGVGEASLHVGGRRIEGKGFIGREVDWANGRGRHAVDAEVGVGEIEVRLVD